MNSFLAKWKNKITTTIRRARLGKRYKHQYACHPNFSIERGEEQHKIRWHGQLIARVGNIKTLKQQYSKMSCFTIAAGPSLNDIDFTQLAPYDCISLNCSIKKFADQSFKPKHCIIVDRKVFENSWECVEASILSGATCYFSSVGLSLICEYKPDLLKHGNIFLIEAIGRQFGLPRPVSISEFQKKYQNDPDIYLPDHIPSRGAIGFSGNAEKGFFSGKTVATWAVQLSQYLGYKDNYILGMDLGGTGKSYFDSKNHTAVPYDFIALYDPYIKVCFEQAQRAANEMEFSLYNLSQYSTLPDKIVKKISLNTALEKASNSHSGNSDT